MRFEGKTEQEAVERALRELKRPAAELRYQVVRDERSFWGGRVVEIEVEAWPAAAAVPAVGGEVEEAAAAVPAVGGEAEEAAAVSPGADEEAAAAVEATLTELLSAAGFLLEVRRRGAEELVFELIGDDVEPLLANEGEGLQGLEVLTGRIAGKGLGRPIHPRLDAEGFRARRREALEQLARRTADQAKKTQRTQLLPPLSPGERRLVHLALAADPEVETESEGDGFLKRVAVRLKTGS
jgi:spoIIIJ-associated protein